MNRIPSEDENENVDFSNPIMRIFERVHRNNNHALEARRDMDRGRGMPAVITQMTQEEGKDILEDTVEDSTKLRSSSSAVSSKPAVPKKSAVEKTQPYPSNL